MCFTNLQMGFGDVRAVMTSGVASIDNWRGRNIHIFVFKDSENNGFQKKLMRQNILYIEYSPLPIIDAGYATGHDYIIKTIIVEKVKFKIYLYYRKKSLNEKGNKKYL